MCKYVDTNGRAKCPYKSLVDSDYCIFHLKDDTKDVDEFNKGINDILEAEEDVFIEGFYFPPGTTDFSTKTFKKKVDFVNVIFSGDVDFLEAKFLENATFAGVIFSGEALFDHVTFSGNAHFMEVTFSEGLDFTGTTFIGGAFFQEVIFSRNAIFWDAKFLGKTFFQMVNFLGGTAFRRTEFLGLAHFKRVEFAGRCVLIPNKSNEIIFEDTYFSDDVRIKADMSKCSFSNSNIERIDMTDSIWIGDTKTKKSFSTFIEWSKTKIGFSETSIIIWDEHQGKLSSNWKELEGTYRRLKQSYLKFGDNSTAGKFYYQEMECKRKQLRGIEKLFWYIFYKQLCGYGEKPFNVIWASIFLIIVSAFLYLFSGIEFVGSSFLKIPPNLIDYNLSLNSFNFQWVRNIDSIYEDFLVCLYTSVITFTTLGYGDVHPIGFSRAIASVEAGFGIIMTALFIFVFTRKMLR